MKPYIAIFALTAAFCCTLMTATPVFAQEEEDIPPHVQAQIEKLRRLREEDPEAFHKYMHEKKVRTRERLEYLREHDPEKFRELVQKHRKERMRHLHHLRENDPEKFRAMMRHRHEQLEGRFDDLKERDPEKFARMMKHRKSHRQQFRKILKDEYPEVYADIHKKHPELFEKKHHKKEPHNKPFDTYENDLGPDDFWNAPSDSHLRRMWDRDQDNDIPGSAPASHGSSRERRGGRW